MVGVGAFGKMPSLGDFFRIHAASSFVDPWDRWLQQSMIVARNALGDRWQDCYMSAPIWRFTLPAGLTGPTAMQGVLMPSVDRVGRMFPLTLMTRLSTSSEPTEQHASSGAFFNALELIALETLSGAVSRDALETQLQHVMTPPLRQSASVPEHPPSRSVWSAQLEQGPLMMTCESLPTAREICGLFDLNAPIWDAPETLPEVGL